MVGLQPFVIAERFLTVIYRNIMYYLMDLNNSKAFEIYYPSILKHKHCSCKLLQFECNEIVL
jgi:hypothetical protein